MVTEEEIRRLQMMANIAEANRRHEARLKGIKVLDRLEPKEKSSVVIRGLRGLGDNINQRAFIKEMARPVYLDTPWPEIYSDLDFVKFVPCETPLRTQIKNIKRQDPSRFVQPPEKDFVELRVSYGSRDLQQGSILKKLSWIFGDIRPKVFDLPDFETKFRCDKPVAVIRPATVRKEWAAVSRNPDPAYLVQAAKILQEFGYFVVSVADTEPDVEWIVGEEPPANLKYHKGELPVEELLGLCRYANVLVGGHGFLTHVALAYKKPMLVVMGGFGGDNHPVKIADKEYQDIGCLTFAVPDQMCLCTQMSHTGCNKLISGFEEKVKNWIGGLE